MDKKTMNTFTNAEITRCLKSEHNAIRYKLTEEVHELPFGKVHYYTGKCHDCGYSVRVGADHPDEAIWLITTSIDNHHREMTNAN